MRSGVVDASAILAMLLDETSASEVREQLHACERLLIASCTVVESRIALSRQLGRDAKPEIDRFLNTLGVLVVPFTATHADTAHEAYLRYGEGRHSAQLNFGDCMAYAAAKVARAQLIYVGNDFAQTDLA